jgi:hypothetical protein
LESKLHKGHPDIEYDRQHGHLSGKYRKSFRVCSEQVIHHIDTSTFEVGRSLLTASVTIKDYVMILCFIMNATVHRSNATRGREISTSTSRG